MRRQIQQGHRPKQTIDLGDPSVFQHMNHNIGHIGLRHLPVQMSQHQSQGPHFDLRLRERVQRLVRLVRRSGHDLQRRDVLVIPSTRHPDPQEVQHHHPRLHSYHQVQAVEVHARDFTALLSSRYRRVRLSDGGHADEDQVLLARDSSRRRWRSVRGVRFNVHEGHGLPPPMRRYRAVQHVRLQSPGQTPLAEVPLQALLLGQVRTRPGEATRHSQAVRGGRLHHVAMLGAHRTEQVFHEERSQRHLDRGLVLLELFVLGHEVAHREFHQRLMLRAVLLQLHAQHRQLEQHLHRELELVVRGGRFHGNLGLFGVVGPGDGEHPVHRVLELLVLRPGKGDFQGRHDGATNLKDWVYSWYFGV